MFWNETATLTIAGFCSLSPLPIICSLCPYVLSVWRGTKLLHPVMISPMIRVATFCTTRDARRPCLWFRLLSNHSSRWPSAKTEILRSVPQKVTRGQHLTGGCLLAGRPGNPGSASHQDRVGRLSLIHLPREKDGSGQNSKEEQPSFTAVA